MAKQEQERNIDPDLLKARLGEIYTRPLSSGSPGLRETQRLETDRGGLKITSIRIVDHTP